MKILVVDDSMVMRNIIRNTLLEKNIDGAEILEAPNGKKALGMLEHDNFDLLFLDWNMPELDGLQLVNILRSMEKYRDMPIVMVTAEAAKYNVMEAIKAGVTDYIIKPITGNAILKKVEQFMTPGKRMPA